MHLALQAPAPEVLASKATCLLSLPLQLVLVGLALAAICHLWPATVLFKDRVLLQ
jgi:hypothetical protein